MLDKESSADRTRSGSYLTIADDLTGALEIGAIFAANGLNAVVATDLDSVRGLRSPALVLDTETRHLDAQHAAARTRQIAIHARDLSSLLIYKKTDSTLRGNIAAE